MKIRWMKIVLLEKKSYSKDPWYTIEKWDFTSFLTGGIHITGNHNLDVITRQFEELKEHPELIKTKIKVLQSQKF